MAEKLKGVKCKSCGRKPKTPAQIEKEFPGVTIESMSFNDGDKCPICDGEIEVAIGE